MTDLAATVAELAELWPALAAALERDTGGDGGAAGRTWTATLVVNTDVLAAMVTLDREVPAAIRAACEAVSEPWRHRDIEGCLRQVPRLASRLHDLSMAAGEKALTWQAGSWLRMVKRALGLRKPDTDIGRDCPYAADFPALHYAAALRVTGDEGFLHHDGGGYRVEWVHTPLVYCASADCGAQWSGAAQWSVLGRMLEATAATA